MAIKAKFAGTCAATGKSYRAGTLIEKTAAGWSIAAGASNAGTVPTGPRILDLLPARKWDMSGVEMAKDQIIPHKLDVNRPMYCSCAYALPGFNMAKTETYAQCLTVWNEATKTATCGNCGNVIRAIEGDDLYTLGILPTLRIERVAKGYLALSARVPPAQYAKIAQYMFTFDSEYLEDVDDFDVPAGTYCFEVDVPAIEAALGILPENQFAVRDAAEKAATAQAKANAEAARAKAQSLREAMEAYKDENIVKPGLTMLQVRETPQVVRDLTYEVVVVGSERSTYAEATLPTGAKVIRWQFEYTGEPGLETRYFLPASPALDEAKEAQAVEAKEIEWANGFKYLDIFERRAMQEEVAALVSGRYDAAHWGAPKQCQIMRREGDESLWISPSGGKYFRVDDLKNAPRTFAEPVQLVPASPGFSPDGRTQNAIIREAGAGNRESCRAYDAFWQNQDGSLFAVVEKPDRGGMYHMPIALSHERIAQVVQDAQDAQDARKNEQKRDTLRKRLQMPTALRETKPVHLDGGEKEVGRSGSYWSVVSVTLTTQEPDGSQMTRPGFYAISGWWAMGEDGDGGETYTFHENEREATTTAQNRFAQLNK